MIPIDMLIVAAGAAFAGMIGWVGWVASRTRWTAPALPWSQAAEACGDPDDATRRAARQAVAAIQARLPGASPGQLSLAPSEAGGLSLAEDERGRLSLDGTTKP